MRNLKKALALVLALMMALSLMVTASASDYADGSNITKTEAVDVMSAINVFQGTDGGNFDPAGHLTRAQAAKIISYMKLGADGAEALPKDESPFDDVKADRWYTGYVAYAKAEGIINGRSEKVFDPTGDVTGYEFGKMVLEAAGIKGEYANTSAWAININLNLRKYELLEGNEGITLSAPITREQACQMAFKGLNYTPGGAATGKWIVKDVATGTNKPSIPATVKFDSYAAAVQTVASLNSSAKIGVDYTVEPETDNSGSLAAGVFNLSSTDGEDAFGAPARVWSVADKGEVARAATAANKSYTSTNLETIKKDLKIAAGTTIAIKEDGKTVTVANDKTAIGGAGSEVDVYVGDTVTVIVKNTYLGTVKKGSYKAADAEKKTPEQVQVTVGSVAPGTATGDLFYVNNKLTKEDEEKFVLYTAAYDSEEDVYAVVNADFPAEVAGVVTRSNAATFVMGDKTYNYSRKAVVTKATVDQLVLDKTEVTFFTDKDGNVMGVKPDASVATAAVYALVKDATIVTSTGWDRVVRAKLLGTDGKVSEVVVTKLIDAENTEKALISGGNLSTDMEGVKGKFVQIVKDGDDTKVKLYVGANVDGKGDGSITRNTPKLGDDSNGFNTIANAKTVFLYEDAQGSVTVYTGISTVPTATYTGANARAVVGGNAAVVVYVKAPAIAPDSTSASDIVYVAVASHDTATTGNKGTLTSYNAVVNGEITTIEVEGNALKVAGTAIDHETAKDQLLSGVTKNADTELITDSAALSANVIAWNDGYGAAADGVIEIGATSYSYNDDTHVYLIEDGVITAGTMADLDKGDVNDAITGYTVNGVIAALFVTSVADPAAD